MIGLFFVFFLAGWERVLQVAGSGLFFGKAGGGGCIGAFFFFFLAGWWGAAGGRGIGFFLAG